MILRPALALLLASLAAPAVALADPAPPSATADAKEWFPKEANAALILETAIADARASHRLAVIVFGADWCHDSRALAGILTSQGFTREFGSRFAVTFIDVGKPQTGEGRNLDLVAGLGVKDLHSTPALFVVGGDGKAFNSDKDAVSWRNAAKRKPEAILGWFRKWAKRPR